MSQKNIDLIFMKENEVIKKKKRLIHVNLGQNQVEALSVFTHFVYLFIHSFNKYYWGLTIYVIILGTLGLYNLVWKGVNTMYIEGDHTTYYSKGSTFETDE